MNNRITIITKENSYDLDKNQIRQVLDITIDLNAFTVRDISSDVRAIQTYITRYVEDKIMDKHLDRLVDEVIKKVDIDSIAKKVKYEIIKKSL